MKFLAAALLAALAVAAPVAEPEALPMSEAGDFMTRELHARQFGSTENQLVSGACRRITFIFARGSTEPGNVVRTIPVFPTVSIGAGAYPVSMSQSDLLTLMSLHRVLQSAPPSPANCAPFTAPTTLPSKASTTPPVSELTLLAATLTGSGRPRGY